MDTPYQIMSPERVEELKAEARASGIDPKRVRPDGTVEADNSISPDVMRAFLEKVGAVQADGGGAQMTAGEIADASLQTRVEQASSLRVMDGETGEITGADKQKPGTALDPFKADEPTQKVIFAKVARYLDPKMKSPLMCFEVRHKLFVMKIPAAQEMIDVVAFSGERVNQEEIPLAQQMLAVVGECIKACLGWVPAQSPDAQLVRAHINDPTLWPKLRPIDWLASRDKTAVAREAYPLFKQFQAWRESVEPTAEEIDFYYSRLG